HLPGALLNNGGDTVRLIRPDGVVVDSTNYTDSAPDVSHSRGPDGSWYDSSEPTPGAANTPPSAGPSATLRPGEPTAPDTHEPAPNPASSLDSGHIKLNEVLPAPKDAFDAEW